MQPVVQPVVQPAASCKHSCSRLYNPVVLCRAEPSGTFGQILADCVTLHVADGVEKTKFRVANECWNAVLVRCVPYASPWRRLKPCVVASLPLLGHWPLGWALWLSSFT